ncbi:MAG: glycoside hydrolase family 140 protein [Verrucomicrobia bacterium]|nr:glycoside hydrolase family 140 protein [Verrucomicrobiota bacterium]MCF7707797.1 glycoside hydrolase family 140 protein [Verrucomicrobiota bacterium]
MITGALFFSTPTQGTAANAPELSISENNRFIIDSNGKPFFYLGDTAWELFHRLDRQEAAMYLKNRADKGFTVIQAVVLAELDGLHTPNANGDVPLIDDDPAKPNEAYFKHVDFIVNRAEELGLFIGMLPTWGDKVNKKWGVGPVVFTPENAKVYGKFLGQRYKNKPIIWILGGDRNPENEQHLDIWNAMAEGIRNGDAGNHLITYHPMGGHNSAEWFHNKSWLDFNMFQSGHGARDIPNYEVTLENYRRQPVKPTLDGEPRYEDHPVNWNPDNGWFNEFDVRQAAYWSLLSGACGHTYGNHNIWQMWQPGRTPISHARTPWKEAINHPGAFQMGIIKDLFESRSFAKLVPDQSLLSEDNKKKGPAHCVAARASDGGFILAYTPYGETLDINLAPINGDAVQAYWFNPRNGESTRIGEFKADGSRKFSPPSDGRGNDWVLILDDASRNPPPPGTPAE